MGSGGAGISGVWPGALVCTHFAGLASLKSALWLCPPLAKLKPTDSPGAIVTSLSARSEDAASWYQTSVSEVSCACSAAPVATAAGVAVAATVGVGVRVALGVGVGDPDGVGLGVPVGVCT